MNCAIIIAEGVYKSSIQPKGPERLMIKYTIKPAQTGGIEVRDPKKLTIYFLKKNFLVAIRYPKKIDSKKANKVDTKLTCNDIPMASKTFDVSSIFN